MRLDVSGMRLGRAVLRPSRTASGVPLGGRFPGMVPFAQRPEVSGGVVITRDNVVYLVSDLRTGHAVVWPHTAIAVAL